MIRRGYFADMVGGVRKGFKVGKAGSGFFLACSFGAFRRPTWASLSSIAPGDHTRIRTLQCGPLTCVSELPAVLGRGGSR